MTVDAILQAFEQRRVDAILIGGMNFFLRHQPVTTFDVDFWIKDTDENLAKVVAALGDIGANWGKTEETWGPIPAGFYWLRDQSVYCLTSAYGPIDIFLEVAGLEGNYDECRARSDERHTATGISYLSLSDQDMIACQMALPESERKLDRIRYLENLQ